jgi:D-3-phosphoglycerate dehydrogenase
VVGSNPGRLVYFGNWVDPAAERLLSGRPEIELLRLDYASPEAENWAKIRLAHGYQIAPRTELRQPWFGDAALLERCPNLLAISSTGAGFDMVDVEACTANGVIVCNQSGSNKEAVAEHALALMLSLSKKIALLNRAMQREAVADRFAYTGNDLQGKTVGIVGIGQIGTRTAELCRAAFGMTVLAYDPYLAAAEIEQRGASKVSFEELLRRSDFVSVHCPRTAETMRLFRAAEFAQMKPTAYFINTARGGIHDEDDLVQALTEGRIAGAGVDVFLKEPPPPDHKLLRLDNVIATSHTAGITAESLRNMAVFAAEQWIAIFSGQVPPRLVNPAAWPRYAERFEQLLGAQPATLA